MFRQRDSRIAKSAFALLALLMLSMPTLAQIDNCCGIDRQCSTNDEWVSGYYAFRNNQCAAPSQQQPRSSQSQPQTATSEAVNNCCFTGWQCTTDAEWTSGYWAFQENQCASQSNWQEQWQRRQNGNQQAESNNQQAESNNQPTKRDKKPRPASTEPDDSTVNWCPCPRLDRSMPGVVSVRVDLTDPNKRVIENDDGSFIIIDPDLPD